MAKIIVIDDELDVRESVNEVLIRAGFDVEAVDNGEDGINLVKENCPDLVITDIIMPGTDGIDVIRSVRAECPETPIIVISGGGNIAPMEYEPAAIKTEAYLASASEAGANITLTKPFSRNELLSAVRKLLN